MKLIPEKFEKLKVYNVGHLVLRGALTPQLITSLITQDKEGPVEHADVELGWSGLQVCCSNLEAYEILKKFEHKTTGYLLEGAGYLSISAEMIEGFEKKKEFPLFDGADMNTLVQIVSMLVSGQMREEDRKDTAIILHFAPTNLLFPDTHIGIGCHVMIEVSEEAWMNLYQVHGVELKACAEWHQKMKGSEAPSFIAKGDLSSNRSLN